MVRVVVSMAFEQASRLLRERHGTLVLVQRYSMDKSLVFQVPEIDRLVKRITQIALRHDPKGADGRQRPRFGSAQRVVAIAVVNQIALRPAWQVEVAHEHIARIETADVVLPVARLTVAVLTPFVVTLAHVVLGGTIADRR